MSDRRKMSFVSILIRLVPPLNVLVFLGYTYYVYVIEICLTIPERNKKYAYIGAYHFLLIMSLWCFIKVLLSKIPLVPKRFVVSSDVLEKLINAETDEMKHRILDRYCEVKQITVLTRTPSGYIRFCKYCAHVKPDRTHHCSSCETCVLRMDHHCPWVSNCICLTNHKSFTLMLFYFTLYYGFIFGTTFEYYLVSWKTTSMTVYDFHVLFLFASAFLMGFILVVFFSYHVSLVLTNTTTIERLTPPNFEDEKLSYNLGAYDNVVQVFGNNCVCCCFPIEKTTCDGINFDTTYLD